MLVLARNFSTKWNFFFSISINIDIPSLIIFEGFYGVPILLGSKASKVTEILDQEWSQKNSTREDASRLVPCPWWETWSVELNLCVAAPNIKWSILYHFLWPLMEVSFSICLCSAHCALVMIPGVRSVRLILGSTPKFDSVDLSVRKL